MCGGTYSNDRRSTSKHGENQRLRRDDEASAARFGREVTWNLRACNEAESSPD